MKSERVLDAATNSTHPFVEGVLTRGNRSFVSWYDRIPHVKDCIGVQGGIRDANCFILEELLEIKIKSAHVERAQIVVRHGGNVNTSKHTVRK